MIGAPGLLPRHASKIPLLRCLLIYLVALVGYVRPCVVSELDFTVEQTAIVSSAGNIGINIGAIFWASLLAWAGRRWPAFAVAAAIGLFAAILAGHILALGSPLLAAWASEGLGLVTAMSLAAAVYLLGAALWFLLPETLDRNAPGAAALATT